MRHCTQTASRYIRGVSLKNVNCNHEHAGREVQPNKQQPEQKQISEEPRRKKFIYSADRRIVSIDLTATLLKQILAMNEAEMKTRCRWKLGVNFRLVISKVAFQARAHTGYSVSVSFSSILSLRISQGYLSAPWQHEVVVLRRILKSTEMLCTCKDIKNERENIWPTSLRYLPKPSPFC